MHLLFIFLYIFFTYLYFCIFHFQIKLFYFYILFIELYLKDGHDHMKSFSSEAHLKSLYTAVQNADNTKEEFFMRQDSR